MKYSFRFLLLLVFALTMWISSAKAQEDIGLQTVKLGSPVAVAGGFMTYSIFVVNDSGVSCADVPFFNTFCDVTIVDTPPAGFIYSDVDIDATHYSLFNPPVAVPCATVLGEIVCDVGDFLPGDYVALNIPGSADGGLTVGTILTNDAEAFASGLILGFPFMTDPVADSFDTEIVAITPEADLTIFKTDVPDPVISGEIITYTLAIFNGGPNPVNGVNVLDVLPPGTTLVPPLPGPCAPGPMNTVTCNFPGVIPPGEVRRFDIAVQAPILLPGDDPISILNIAAVQSAAPDPSPANNSVAEATTVVPPPLNQTLSDLIVTKTSPETVIQGEQFFYTVNIFNEGPDTADNVRFRDAPFMNTVIDIPGILSTQPVSCVALPAVPNFRCDLQNPLPAGQSVTLIIPATYTGPLPIDPLPIFNAANVILGPSNLPDTVQVDPEPLNNTDIRVTNVVAPPPVLTTSDLVVTKSMPDVVIQNEGFGVFIEVANTGPDTAQNVQLRDLLPPGLTITGVLPSGCSIVPGVPPARDEIQCALGDIVNGETVRLGFRAVYDGVVPALPLSVPFFNLATVDFGPVGELVQIDPETADNTFVEVSRAIEPPSNINLVDLFLVKTDSPDPVVVEEELTYNLNIYNFGPNDAVGVVVTDTLPMTVTNINVPGYCAVNLNVVTCQLPNPIPANGGLAIVPITVDAPSDQGMILNAAQTFADPFALLESDNAIQIDFAPSNNTDSEKTTVVPVPPPVSDLLITKSDTPDPVIEDDYLTYTIFVKNTGPDPAYGVLVSDWLSQLGLDLTDVTFQNTPNVLDCVQNPDFPIFDEPYKVECEIPFLGVEESATITIKVKTLPLPNGFEFLNIFNLAKVQSLGDVINPASADPNMLNNVVVESTLIGPFVPIADVFVIKSDSPDPVIVDRTLTYVLFASNAGPDPATDVVIVDTLPDTVDFVSAVPNQGSCNYNAGMHTVVCSLGNLDVGAFTEVRLEVTPRVLGTILNVAQISADEHDPKSSNNISPQTTTVIGQNVEPPDGPGEPNGNDLFALKFVSPNPAAVGDEVLFTIIVGNNGEFAEGATLVDDLPPGLTFISATVSTGDTCELVNGDVRCEIGSIPPLGQGETVVVEVLVRADQTGSLPNIAFLDDVSNDPNSTNNVSIVTVNIVPAGDTPQPTQTPDNPTGGGNTGGDSGSDNSNGCTVAAGTVNTGNSAVNIALLLLPLLVFGVRRYKNKK